MNRRPRLLLASIVFVLLAGVVLGGPAVAAAAPKKGSGGWYWPVGTEDFHGWDGFWTHRPGNHSWHMAQDMPVPQGHAVYAIADGVIAESNPNAGYNGVLVVWHVTGDGQKFLAVYGHIIRGKGMNKGVKVKAGQVIGHVNSYNHCHFGVHPGDKYPPDGNPYRGHTYIESETYGWVDPVKFLKNNPANLPYTAPPLPCVATVSTVSTPCVLGVADGSVYWNCASAVCTPTVFSRLLPSGETTQLAEDARLPQLDATRYLVKTSRTAFTLWDRLPVVTTTFSTTQPLWAHPIAVAGTLKSASGKLFSGAKVALERSTNGGKTWVAVAGAIVGPKGTFSLGYAPSRTYRLRVKFTPPATFIPATSAEVTVSPKPGLHAPDTAKQTTTGRKVTLSGMLDARHPAGAHTVALCLQRLGPTGWTTVLTTWSANANAGKASTRYSRQLTLAAGSWRVFASCPADSMHAAESTCWKGFKVK